MEIRKEQPMVKIENNNICLTRGDTLNLEISLIADGTPYTMSQNDKLYLTIRKSDKNVVFEQVLTGSNIFEIDTEDTATFDLGNYIYSVTAIFEDNSRATPIVNRNFTLYEEGREIE